MKSPGRNEPCPCGSGKKYKNCCISAARQAQKLRVVSALEDEPRLAPKLGDKNRLTSRSALREIQGLDLGAVGELIGVSETYLDQFVKKISLSDLQLRRDEDHIYIESEVLPDRTFAGVRWNKRGDLSFAAHNRADEQRSCALLLTLIHPILQKKLLARGERTGFLKMLMTALPTAVSEQVDADSLRLKAIILEVPKLKAEQATDLSVQPSREHSLPILAVEEGPFSPRQRSVYHHADFQKLGFKSGFAFLFSDGTLVSATDLDRHPYCLILDPIWLSGDLKAVGSSSRLSRLGLWFDSDLANYSCPPIDSFRAHLFSTAVPLIQEGKLELYLTESLSQFVLTKPKKSNLKIVNMMFTKSSTKLSATRINTVQSLSVEDLNWSLDGKLKLTVDCPKISKGTTNIGHGWLYNAKLGQLTMTPVAEVMAAVGRQTMHLTHKEQNPFDGERFVFKLYDFDVVKYAQNHIASQGGTLQFTDLTYVSPEDIGISVELNSQYPDQLKFGLALKTIDQKLETSMRYAIARAICGRIDGGLDSYDPYIRYSVTSGRKPEVRRADQKLIKHQGFHRILQLTVAEALAKTEPSSKTKDQKRKILETLKERSRFIFPEFKDFSEAISKSLERTIIESIEKLIDDHSNPTLMLVHLGDRFVQIDFSGLEAQFSGLVLNALLAVEGPDALQRATTKGLELTPIYGSRDEVQGLFLMKHPKASLLAMQFLGRPEVEFKVDGNGVESLPEEALTALIECGAGTEQGDWFDLNPQVFFNGTPISEVDARRFAEGGFVPYGGKIYFVDRSKLPTAKWLDFFWRKIQGRGQKRFEASTSTPIVQQQRHQILTLLGLKLAGIPVIGGPEWQKALKTYERLTSPSSEDSPIRAELVATKLPLKPFQLAGSEWLVNLYELGLGGILADDMGLGKTIQTLGLLSVLHKRRELGRCLIVVPSSLVHNWKGEIERFAPDLPVQSLLSKKEIEQNQTIGPQSKDSAEAMITITTYGILNENFDQLAVLDWNIAIFDEAQNLKNIRSKRAGSARLLNARLKYCLTGTPLENHYGEYYALIDLCVPGALGPYDEFCSTYVPSGPAKATAISKEDIEFLRHKTAALVLRRLKSTILSELPEKTETLIKLEFDPSQQKIYRDAALSWNKSVQELIEINGEAKSQLQMLTALLRLRQICSAPQTVPNTKYKAVPPKFSELLEALTELSEKAEPVVVFTNFRQTLLELQQVLEKHGIFCLSITGATPTAQRAKILESFERAQGHVVLLMTQKVGGVGLNLTKASYVFHLEPWWNPQVENQASDRVHRIGQKRAVQIYRYIMKDSVEEKIQQLKLLKSQLFDQLFESESLDAAESGNFSSARLSKEDFLWLVDEGKR